MTHEEADEALAAMLDLHDRGYSFAAIGERMGIHPSTCAQACIDFYLEEAAYEPIH